MAIYLLAFSQNFALILTGLKRPRLSSIFLFFWMFNCRCFSYELTSSIFIRFLISVCKNLGLTSSHVDDLNRTLIGMATQRLRLRVYLPPSNLTRNVQLRLRVLLPSFNIDTPTLCKCKVLNWNCAGANETITMFPSSPNTVEIRFQSALLNGK